MKTAYAVSSIVGPIRQENQDNFYLNGATKPMKEAEYQSSGTSTQPSQVFAVCDGMGGEAEGEVAAFLAVEAFKDYPHEQLFRQWNQYVSDANQRICRAQRSRKLQMGTTLAGVVLRNNQVQIFNLGDSRIYRIRQGRIEQLSKDHTAFQAMMDAGLAPKEERSVTRARNQLSQNLGIEPEELELAPHAPPAEEARNEDWYLLCSDGLYSVVSEEEILQIVIETQLPLQGCQKLVYCAEKRGGRDNITALLICVLDDKKKVQTIGKASVDVSWKERIKRMIWTI